MVVINFHKRKVNPIDDTTEMPQMWCIANRCKLVAEL